MVEILFVGTGNAFNPEGLGNTVTLLRGEGFCYCVDCGPTTLMQLNRFGIDPSSITHYFFTHFHGDHIAGFPFLLLHGWEMGRNPISIYGPQGLKERLGALCEICYPGIMMDHEVTFHEFPVEQNSYSLEPQGSFTTFPMLHSPESVAFRFCLGEKEVAITGDTGWNENFLPLADGADLLITECTLPQPGPMHMSVVQLKENIEALGAKQVVPVHLYGEVKGQLAAWNHAKIQLVEDGDSIEL